MWDKALGIERTHMSDVMKDLLCKNASKSPCTGGSFVSEDELDGGQDQRSIVREAAVVKQQTQVALTDAMQYYQLAETAKLDNNAPSEHMMKLRCKQAIEAASKLLAKLKKLNSLLDGSSHEVEHAQKATTHRQSAMLHRLFGGIEAIAGSTLSPAQWSTYLNSQSGRHVVPTAVRDALKRNIDSSGDGQIEPHELSAYRKQVNLVRDQADMMNWMKSRSFDRTVQDLTREIDLSRTESEARLESVKKEEELLNEKLHVKYLRAQEVAAQHKLDLQKVKNALQNKEAAAKATYSPAAVSKTVKKAVDKLASVAVQKIEAKPSPKGGKAPAIKVATASPKKSSGKTASPEKLPPKIAKADKSAQKALKKAATLMKTNPKMAKKQLKKAKKQMKREKKAKKKAKKLAAKEARLAGKVDKDKAKASVKLASTIDNVDGAVSVMSKATRAVKKALTANTKSEKLVCAAEKASKKASKLKAIAATKAGKAKKARAARLAARADRKKVTAAAQLSATEGKITQAEQLMAQTKKATKKAIRATKKSKKAMAKTQKAVKKEVKEQKEAKKAGVA